MLQDAAGAFRGSIHQECRGFAQRNAAEIIRDAVPFDTIEERRDLDQLGPNRNEALFDDRARRR